MQPDSPDWLASCYEDRSLVTQIAGTIVPADIRGEILRLPASSRGMAYDDGSTHVVSLDGGLRMSLTSPERALRVFSRRAGLAARLVWFAAPVTAELDQVEAA